MCRVGLRITHLFFADDCLLFCKANPIECAKIQHILTWYEAASGQKVNTNQTTAFFSKNTFEEAKEELRVLLGVSVCERPQKVPLTKERFFSDF